MVYYIFIFNAATRAPRLLGCSLLELPFSEGCDRKFISCLPLPLQYPLPLPFRGLTDCMLLP
jgi:hypothetical protein